MPPRKRPPRTFTHSHRVRLERAAEQYLEECYRTKSAARASEFATKYLEVTAPYLSRIVPQIAGASVRDFLRERQLAYAERLLTTTPLVINEIAIRCGFGTERTFYRCFREARGMTPGVFREVMK